MPPITDPDAWPDDPVPVPGRPWSNGSWFGRIRCWFARRAMETAPGGPGGVLGYLGVRRAIGYLGIALPIALPAVTWIFGGAGGLAHGPVFRDSLSAYYYSGIGGSVFVGSIFAIGVFLLVYRYRRLDDMLGNVGCGSAMALALFPTNDKGVKATWSAGYIHLISASVFLVTLALICIFVFTLGDKATRTLRKRHRNTIYFSCGSIMAVALIGALASQFFVTWHYTLLICETLAVWAFGFAWIVKGEVLLKDERPRDLDGT